MTVLGRTRCNPSACKKRFTHAGEAFSWEKRRAALPYFLGFESGRHDEAHDVVVAQVAGDGEYAVGCRKVDVPLVAGYGRIEGGFDFGNAASAFGIGLEFASFHTVI